MTKEGSQTDIMPFYKQANGMKENKKTLPLMPWMERAEQAGQEMMKKLIEERRRSGIPLAFLRDGKVVLVPANEVKAEESTNGHVTDGTRNGQ